MPRKRRKTVHSVLASVPSVQSSSLLEEAQHVESDLLEVLGHKPIQEVDQVEKAPEGTPQQVQTTLDAPESAPEPAPEAPPRITLVALKQQAQRPELVEWHDTTAANPEFLVSLKSSPGAVPVPETWQGKEFRQKYLRSQPYKLPRNVYETGIAQLRNVHENGAEELAQAAKSRIQPRLGELDLDLPKLEAAFRNQPRPTLSGFGQVQRSLESEYSAVPGKISDRLAGALGMAKGGEVPWLAAMNAHGFPPAYGGVRLKEAPPLEVVHWGSSRGARGSSG